MSLARGVYIIAAKRSPFGAFGGVFTNTSACDLSVVAVKAAMKAAEVNPSLVDSVIMGNVLSLSSSNGPYLARHVLLHSGIPLEKTGYTVNRLCGSGFQSIINGVQEIMTEQSKLVVAGGAENMSQCPYCVRNIRFGTKLGAGIHFEDSLWLGLSDSYCNLLMALTAEKLAKKFNISREETDKYALRSQQLCKKAQESGYYKEEIAPVTLSIRKENVVIEVDEHPKRDSTLEGLQKLPSLFEKNGVVTAGTSSGICDGAAAVILASEEMVKKNNFKPLARIVGYSVVGVDPSIMGIGPSPAIKELLKKTNLSFKDIDLIEINEAFAAQTLACAKDLCVDVAKLNVNGGAIPLGHPLGASGTRIASHLVYELRRRKAKYGIGSACIGGGQGIAILLEAIN